MSEESTSSLSATTTDASHQVTTSWPCHTICVGGSINFPKYVGSYHNEAMQITWSTIKKPNIIHRLSMRLLLGFVWREYK